MIIAAGGSFKCHEKEGVIGAVIIYHHKTCFITVYHILKAGKCDLGSMVSINSFRGKVIEIIWEYDLAVIAIDAPESEIDISDITEPIIGPAYSLNGAKKIDCNVMTIGKTYHYVSFPMGNIPIPGDSGSPIIQDGKVVGILASIFYNNAAGIVVSTRMFNPHNKFDKEQINK